MRPTARFISSALLGMLLLVGCGQNAPKLAISPTTPGQETANKDTSSQELANPNARFGLPAPAKVPSCKPKALPSERTPWLLRGGRRVNGSRGFSTPKAPIEAGG